MNQKLKIIVKLLVVALIVGVYYFLQVDNGQPMEEYAHKLGIFGYLFVLIGIVLGGVIIPLSALPFLFTGLALYGFWTTFFLYYVGGVIISAFLNFWIARKFGRPMVLKLTGKKTILHIDRLTEVAGVKVLIILRLFSGIFFDTISYAMGLTGMQLKHFMLITLLCPIPGMFLIMYLLNKGLSSGPLYLGIIVVWGYLAGALTIYWLYRKNRKTIN